ncbi:hypothetical protein HanHA89_Chr13g0537951 [Helianthus annuus]|nr:hypothetical protein HanHA89_Chr13g0537951 [Helianthus annuus]
MPVPHTARPCLFGLAFNAELHPRSLPVFMDHRICTVVHKVARPCHTPRSVFLTEGSQLRRFIRKVLVFAIILSGMLF